MENEEKEMNTSEAESEKEKDANIINAETRPITDDDIPTLNDKQLRIEGGEEPSTPPKADLLDGEANIHAIKENEKGIYTPLSYVYEDSISFDDEVESLRRKIAPKLKLNKALSMVSVALLLVGALCVVVPVLFFSGKEGANTIFIIMLVVGAVLAVGGLILSITNNHKGKKDVNVYYGSYFNLLCGYTASALSLENVMTCQGAQIDEMLFVQSHLYRTIKRIQSSSALEAKRNGKDLIAGFMAAVVPTISLDSANKLPTDFYNLDGTPYIQGDESVNAITDSLEVKASDITQVDVSLTDIDTKKNKKKSKAVPQEEVANFGLYGWFTSYDMKVESEESIILYFVGARQFNMIPNYTTGFKSVKVPGLNNKVLVFAADPKSSAKFFTQDAVDTLNDIILDDVTQSGFISINSYGTKVGLNMDDKFISAPSDRRDPGLYSSFYHDNKKIFSFIDSVENLSNN